ncbi:MAG: ribonuclease P protein component [bacterium]|nr:ribonuclease P protein component [bacterium]
MAFIKKFRIKKKEDFDRIFKLGKSVRGDLLLIKFLKNNYGYPRFGVVVSGKVSGKAVIRNSIKRKINEALKEIEELKKINLDIIIVTALGIVGKTKKEIKSVLHQAIGKIYSQQNFRR